MESLESVVIDIPEGGGEQLLKAASAGTQVRLRRFWGTTSAQGTIQFKETGHTAVSGPIRLAARGGFIDLGDQNIDNCLTTAAGQGLVLHSDVAFGGFAKISQM